MKLRARGTAAYTQSLFSEWRTALGTLRDNPLALYWWRTQRRRSRRRPLWRRCWLVLLLLLLGGGLFCWLGLFDAVFSSDPLARLALLLRLVLLPLSLAWLLPQLYLLPHDALACLAAPGKRSADLRVDDLIAVSGLSPAQLVCGIAAGLLRPVLPPLLACGAAVGALVVAGQLGEAAGSGQPWLAWLLLTLSFALTGWLAAAGTALYFLTLGLDIRGAVVPALGGAGHVLLQLVLACGLIKQALDYGSLEFAYLGVAGPDGLTAAGWMLVSLLVLGLLLYIARRWLPLRLWLAFGTLFLAPALFFIEQWFFDLSSFELEIALSVVFMVCWNCFDALTWFNLHALAPGGPLLGWEAGLDSGSGWLGALLRWAMQLGLLILLAGFARDAVRRRQWEARE